PRRASIVSGPPSSTSASSAGGQTRAGGGDAVLALDGVEKSFGPLRALQRTTLHFRRGTTVLLGPSGCRKSTVLRVAIGLVRPDAGTVSLRGRRLEPGSVR